MRSKRNKNNEKAKLLKTIIEQKKQIKLRKTEKRNRTKLLTLISTEYNTLYNNSTMTVTYFTLVQVKVLKALSVRCRIVFEY